MKNHTKIGTTHCKINILKSIFSKLLRSTKFTIIFIMIFAIWIWKKS